MIKKLNAYLVALCFGMTVMTYSCGSLIEEDQSIPAGEDFLKVEVLGLNTHTRSVIEGDSLPYNAKFGIYLTNAGSDAFIDNGFNIEATYRDRECNLMNNVSLSNVGAADVYAFYPFSTSGHPCDMLIDATTQNDYLWGRSEDANGTPTYVNKSNPTAHIRFEHIMARITLRIKRSKTNGHTYYISGISLVGDMENSFRRASINVLQREFISKDYGDYQPIDATLSATDLNSDNELIIADFLVIPSKTQWSLRFKSYYDEYGYYWDALKEMEYESGKQYIFDCEINAYGTFSINRCDIEEWNVTEMPECEATVK